MTSRHFSWIATCLAVGLSACTTFQPGRPDTAKACADWRWIGISKDGVRCPEVPGWTVRPLFPQVAPVPYESGNYCDHAPYEHVPRPKVLQELNRFCVYELASPKGLKGLKSLKGRKGLPFPPAASTDLVRFDQDCAALSNAIQTEAPTPDWKSDFQRFLVQAGKPGTPATIEHAPAVRLAFLDTQPTGEGVPLVSGRSPHGHALAHMARQLVCTMDPVEHCAAQITTQLATPIIKFDPKKRKHNVIDKDGKGGFLGMQSDLAEAIRNEVDDWRREREKTQQHLVLNVSMAWDGDLFSGLDDEQIEDMRAGTQAVYRALQYAADFDVLVVAAAGNKKRLPCESYGPLLPAGWEREAREESCDKGEKKRLLYAVGGVRSNGDRLDNARSGGMPFLSAYADNAVVPSADPEKPTAMLTGSSVAAAVVSSIAAVVWDRFPTKTSQEVMGILDRSGDVLSIPAEFGIGRSALSLTPPDHGVHRISLCAALAKACAEEGTCKVDCPEWEREDLPHRTVPMGTCQPWLYPQPDTPPCMACTTDPPPKGP